MYDKIYNAIKTAVDRGAASGVNCLVKQNGRELAYCEYGFRDLENKVPMTRDTIFRMYSSSKPVTSAAVMLLISRGLIDISQEVGAYLPEFKDMQVNINGYRRPAKNPITVKHLLNMTSGLPYPDENTAGGRQCGTAFWELDQRLYGDSPMTTEEFSRRIAQNDLCFDPGEHFMYGVSADILGALVERVSGVRFGEFLRREFFEPLEMTDTGFWVPPEKSYRLAKAYDEKDGKLAELVTNHLGIKYPADVPPPFESGGAGIMSTVDDYAKFSEMLLNNGEYKGRRILPERAVKYMTNGGLLNEQQNAELRNGWGYLYGYSYGNLVRVCVDESKTVVLSSKGEFGWNGWLGTHFWNEPSHGLTILMGIQRVGGEPGVLARKLKNIVMCEISD